MEENEILKSLDEMIEVHERYIEAAKQGANEALASLESRELACLSKVRNMIKEKSALRSCRSVGTKQKNHQLHYNTDQKKSKIRKLAVEIFDLSLQLRENADGTIDFSKSNVVSFECYNSCMGLIIFENLAIEHKPDYATLLFLDDQNFVKEAENLKKRLTRILLKRGTMQVTGYEYNGFVVPEEEAMKKIEYEVRSHDEDKQDVFDYLWEVVTSDKKLKKEFKEWFFDGVLHEIECDDQGRVKDYFEFEVI